MATLVMLRFEEDKDAEFFWDNFRYLVVTGVRATLESMEREAPIALN